MTDYKMVYPGRSFVYLVIWVQTEAKMFCFYEVTLLLCRPPAAIIYVIAAITQFKNSANHTESWAE